MAEFIDNEAECSESDSEISIATDSDGSEFIDKFDLTQNKLQ